MDPPHRLPIREGMLSPSLQGPGYRNAGALENHRCRLTAFTVGLKSGPEVVSSQATV